MLVALSIRDIVLIDKLDLELYAGLNVLTGETGAGKSILLDSLGLATGSRADKGLVRNGTERGSVSATFDVAKSHSVGKLLDEHSIDVSSANGTGRMEIILRRVQGVDGRSRAFINDESVSIGLLREVGVQLLEVHGQHDDRGLLSASAHRALLDNFARLEKRVEGLKDIYARMRKAELDLDEARANIAEARAQADYFRHVLDELRELATESGEETELSTKRTLMMHAEKIIDDLIAAQKLIDGDRGMVHQMSRALRRLEGANEKAEGTLDGVIEQIDRTLAEAHESKEQIRNAMDGFDFSSYELETVEERLFALRAAARKHNVQPDDLAGLIVQFEERLKEAEGDETRLDALEAEVALCQTLFDDEASTISQERQKAAKKLDKGVAKELRPLKLEKAQFRCEVVSDPKGQRAASGFDRIQFLISTNPGAPLAPMVEIASGGELARFILALKVVLAKRGTAGTLIFDEVDQGIGGAVADAVGERLARLSDSCQVLVVTHSPQVAARADQHWRISKGTSANEVASGESDVVTRIDDLSDKGRHEEIARMLAGAKVTKEARAAAKRLIEAGVSP